jgi:hypothetical protein
MTVLVKSENVTRVGEQYRPGDWFYVNDGTNRWYQVPFNVSADSAENYTRETDELPEAEANSRGIYRS